LEIIVALPENQISHWENLCKQYNFNINHTIVMGGETRYHSVKNALDKTENTGIIAVHDGVRPLVSRTTIDMVFEIASINGNAIPYIDIVDSIRFVESDSNKPVDRNKYKLIQTPQAFDSRIIKSAYEQEWEDSFTDDASIVEKSGIKINLVPGNIENIKITTKTDLKIAETLSSYLLE
jgi:2-C-methyl-D-erythritol 4-phosphate cytidylyltransferase